MNDEQQAAYDRYVSAKNLWRQRTLAPPKSDDPIATHNAAASATRCIQCGDADAPKRVILPVSGWTVAVCAGCEYGVRTSVAETSDLDHIDNRARRAMDREAAIGPHEHYDGYLDRTATKMIHEVKGRNF